jgi:hypothetical protein
MHEHKTGCCFIKRKNDGLETEQRYDGKEERKEKKEILVEANSRSVNKEKGDIHRMLSINDYLES